MAKHLSGLIGAILVGAIVWFVLDVIIGVTVWVSFLAGGVVALVGVLMVLGIIGAGVVSAPRRHRHGPVGAR